MINLLDSQFLCMDFWILMESTKWAASTLKVLSSKTVVRVLILKQYLPSKTPWPATIQAKFQSAPSINATDNALNSQMLKTLSLRTMCYLMPCELMSGQFKQDRQKSDQISWSRHQKIQTPNKMLQSALKINKCSTPLMKTVCLSPTTSVTAQRTLGSSCLTCPAINTNN